MNLSQLARLLRTVRHLRATQVAAQVSHRLRHRLPGQRIPRAGEAPPWPGVRWEPVTDWLAPSGTPATAQQIVSGELCFLNDLRLVGFPPRWDQPDAPKLWRYNLHYMEYLWTLDERDARRLVADWIDNHPCHKSAEGWEPYPTSLRVMNWCALFFGKWKQATLGDAAWRDRLWRSLWQQATWLSGHLEYHLLGNHLMENAVALAIVGACFDGPSAKPWLATACGILDRELPEQILDDGGHFERSPMYQSRMVYALALMRNTGNAELATRVGRYLTSMTDALTATTLPDGHIALLNDSALGIYPEPAALRDWVGRVTGQTLSPQTEGVWQLPHTGYYGARNAKGDAVICDAAPIGPDYLPGHAHADTFTFELCFEGQRVIVDAGNFDYLHSDMRRYCRSTQAHNTVELNGQDQSEMWGAFRVGRRAHVRDVRFTERETGFTLGGHHDGYHHLAGKPTHKRHFTWHQDGVLLVRDTVESAVDVPVATRMHLHPDCAAEQIDDHKILVRWDASSVVIVFTDNLRLSMETGWYCPQFGRRIENTAIVARAQADAPRHGSAFCLARGHDAGPLTLEEGIAIDGRAYRW
ncbi:MAG: heparinase [Phycisphaera sp.]|nr:heparinase [Phycisphaera sp.]